MDDSQLLRYSRHILLPQIGVAGQKKLLAAHVLVIGVGGLGSPVALYLATAGVGKITICDDDTVDLTNLQRQIIHQVNDIGTNKAQSAQQALAAINPEVSVTAIPQRAEGEKLIQWCHAADVVVDASDNFATRHAINRACVATSKPLVSGAAIRFDGQVTVFDLRDTASSCYHCLFPEKGEEEEEQCATMGVFAPLVGVIGAIQAAEVLKLLMGIGQSLTGRLLLFDGLGMAWHTIHLKKDPCCPICA